MLQGAVESAGGHDSPCPNSMRVMCRTRQLRHTNPAAEPGRRGRKVRCYMTNIKVLRAETCSRRRRRADIDISHGWVTLVDRPSRSASRRRRRPPAPNSFRGAVEADDDDEGPPDDRGGGPRPDDAGGQ